MRTLAGVALLGIGLSTPVVAQGTFGPISLSVGAGIEASHLRDGNEWTSGHTLHAALHFQPRTARWGVRASGWFYDRGRNEYPQFSSRSQAAGLGLDATFDLTRGGTRPYVFAGGGMSALFLSLSSAGTVRNSGSAFISGGIGLRHRIGPAALFGELRAVHPLNGHDFGEYLAPLVFGVRF
jgi:hypothetical protein